MGSSEKSIILVKENLSLQTFTILRLFNLQLAVNTVYIFLQNLAVERI